MRCILMTLAAVVTAAWAAVADAEPAAVVHVYGPGGPSPPIREAGKIFGEQTGVRIEITAGPMAPWKEQAARDADLLFSGAEYMMTDFVQRDFPGQVETASIRTLYLRPSAILVRPGNPKGIKGIRDLVQPGLRLVVVQGTGQVAMWEDVVGRTGDVSLLDRFRRNIVAVTMSSAEAKRLWKQDASLDAWLGWNIWHKEDPTATELINTEPEHTIYRSCGIALMKRAEKNKPARDFFAFLQSEKARPIFAKWGWIVK